MVAILLALAALSEAFGYRVRFLTDPLGPRGLPILASALVLIAGLLLAVRPDAGDPGGGPPPEQPDPNPGQPAEGPDGEGVPDAGPLGALAVAGLLFGYSVVLPWIGFVAGTTLVLTGLARVFRARWLPGLVAGLVLSLGLWFLFGAGLGISLPVGTLWAGWGP